MRNTNVILGIVAGCLSASCASSRQFWTYVVDDEVSKPLAEREAGTMDRQGAMSPHNVKVVFNDGSTMTEVLIPVLTSGQQIVIDQQGRPSGQALALVPLPPAEADKSIEEAYVKSGQPLVAKAPPVSIVKTQAKIRELVREGQYALALEYAGQVLKRYPGHAEMLRTKGSLLLKIGEKEAALDAYRRAEEVEPNPRVARLIQSLEEGTSEN